MIIPDNSVLSAFKRLNALHLIKKLYKKMEPSRVPSMAESRKAKP